VERQGALRVRPRRDNHQTFGTTAATAIAVCLYQFAASPAAAQDDPGWRFWVAADGLQESYTRTLGLVPGESITLRHGVLMNMDLLDGFSVLAVAEPRTGTEIDLTRTAGVFALSADEAWAVEANALKQLRHGQWTVRATAQTADEMIMAVPLDSKRIVVLFRNRLAEFDPARNTRTSIPEDNPVNQLLARRLLQKLGHSVSMAATGAEAVRLFELELPDVILMDVQMPVMDGLEATAAIRALESSGTQRTPIIALTAHALHGYREECLRAGMDDYLSKPIKLEDLALALARASRSSRVDPIAKSA
jgi:CheY-like chemotaxis protein